MVKVLVVEDDINIRSLVARFLEKEGYEVHQAADGLEGLDLYEKQHYDILITDVMMPKTDGNQLTAAIRRTNRDIPILMLTAKDTVSDRVQGLDAGADDAVECNQADADRADGIGLDQFNIQCV